MGKWRESGTNAFITHVQAIDPTECTDLHLASLLHKREHAHNVHRKLMALDVTIAVTNAEKVSGNVIGVALFCELNGDACRLPEQFTHN